MVDLGIEFIDGGREAGRDGLGFVEAGVGEGLGKRSPHPPSYFPTPSRSPASGVKVLNLIGGFRCVY